MGFPGESNYWLEGTGPAEAATETSGALPIKVDVVIVGAGYTGLTAALHLARAGRDVAVFEAGGIGFGASSRNGGMVGPGLHKLGIAGLVDAYGEEGAVAILGEGLHALDHLEAFVADEGIECDLVLTGRFRGARSHAHYEASGRECDWLATKIGLPTHHVTRADQRAEIGSDFYRGGVVYERDGGVHPRKLLEGIAVRAVAAGVRIFAPCAVTGHAKDRDGVTLRTARGTLQARDLVLATNGYSDRRSNALNRRIIPLETGACALGPLSPAQMAELTPKGRMHGETGRVFMWYRPTPDGRSFIFGGRFGAGGMDHATREAAFRKSICRVFPQLESAPISHVWSGLIAYTADHSPHLGHLDGVWMAGGYCGSGVTRGIYFGAKLARRMLKQPDADTAFDALRFKPIPFRPFAKLGAGLMVRKYQMQDARDLRTRE